MYELANNYFPNYKMNMNYSKVFEKDSNYFNEYYKIV